VGSGDFGGLFDRVTGSEEWSEVNSEDEIQGQSSSRDLVMCGALLWRKITSHPENWRREANVAATLAQFEIYQALNLPSSRETKRHCRFLSSEFDRLFAAA
jgi:hypothetical protein